MTWSEFAQAITALAAVGAVVMSAVNSHKLGDLHISLNSRLDQLLKSHGKEMKAEGIQEERDRVK